MASIITGLFKSQSLSQKISSDLENAGFQNSDFILYLHDHTVSKEVKTSIWQSFFKDSRELENDNLVVSVKVKEPEQKEAVTRIFNYHNAIHQNFIENIRFKDAESLDYLKRIVALRAKSAIFSSPEIRHRSVARGINSEVFFGKN